MKKIIWLLLALNFQLAAQIIPIERIIVWEGAVGLPEGIPETHVIKDLKNDFGALGDSIADDAPALQRAIDQTPEGGCLHIPQGTYRINSTVLIHKSIVLQGDGAEKSRILLDDEAEIHIGKLSAGSWLHIRAGYSKGSNLLIVENLQSGIEVGGFVEIKQENDPAFMYTNPYGDDWNKGWAAGAVGQVLKVDTLRGDTIIVAEPLNWDYDPGLKPQLRSLTMLDSIGLENLYFERLNPSAELNTLSFTAVAYSWVKDCESYNTYESHIALDRCYRSEVRGSYIHHAYNYGTGGGGYGYGIELLNHSTGCLVEDNILISLRHSLMLHLGANGNVFAYNYSSDCQHDNETDISLHGHMAVQNLVEGNVCTNPIISDWWGPNPRNTLFRNRTAWDRRQRVLDNSDYCNLVGNKHAFESNSGYDIDENVEGTLAHGNFWGGSIHWDPDIPDHSLPDSYYLSSKPSCFDKMPWPATGSDVYQNLYKIPAQLRYESLEHTTGLEEKNFKKENLSILKSSPTPFSSSSRITYRLNKNVSYFQITVYDLKGVLIKELYNGMKESGQSSISWDGRNSTGNLCAAGLYLVRFSSNTFIQTIRIIKTDSSH